SGSARPLRLSSQKRSRPRNAASAKKWVVMAHDRPRRAARPRARGVSVRWRERALERAPAVIAAVDRRRAGVLHQAPRLGLDRHVVAVRRVAEVAVAIDRRLGARPGLAHELEGLVLLDGLHIDAVATGDPGTQDDQQTGPTHDSAPRSGPAIVPVIMVK